MSDRLTQEIQRGVEGVREKLGQFQGAREMKAKMRTLNEAKVGLLLHLGALTYRAHRTQEAMPSGAVGEIASQIRSIDIQLAALDRALVAVGGPHCHQCGIAAQPGAHFCASCGANLKNPPAETRCPACESPRAASAHFCTHCGERLGGA
jgi:predicted Zn-ribbon and HTH transcriptional regulator